MMSLYAEKLEKTSESNMIDFSRLTSRSSMKENGKNGNNNNYNNNYPGARACARVREEIGGKMDEMRDLYAIYCDTFARDRVAAIVRREMAQAIEAGAEPSLIVYALEMAEIAPSPSWAYARAVMRRCMSDGCRTYEDCAARAERVRAPKRGTTYQQRTITDEDVYASFVDPMARRPRT